MDTRHRIGILGAGNIFGRYAEGLRTLPGLELVRVADIEAARHSGRLLGAAPDTFLGSAGQTARHAIDAGLIGEPVGVSASSQQEGRLVAIESTCARPEPRYTR
ncbi:hypothetical protein [Nonomuraea sp. NEAU-A123]|uniref:hypothetical protein n=1 Tax=Nonomuraea sp. NEAU-A123 TaxID=2839649 RepID=UPI001BE4056F|nr:hypothetical protein [Nonomuraea sp. NEAU-A123]MBT2233613.1 hypothetical protein [Nonomuraea sp. NEAU-A123]